MKITKLEKKKRLYLLELDGSEKHYITEDTLVRYFLSKDKEVTQEEIKVILSFSNFSYGKNLALYHLSFQQRTEKEVRDYLTKKEIDHSSIDTIIANLKQENWIDDLKYCHSYIRQNLSSGNKGPYVLVQKLQQKGIAKGLAQEAVSEYTFSELALRLAQKKLQQYQYKLPRQALQTKIQLGLQQGGFAQQDIQEALSQLTIDEDPDIDSHLIEKEFDKQVRKYQRKYQGYELKQRLIQALVRKGYTYSDSKDIVNQNL
ncbi:recombination regulator RecX [Streptococcus sp. DD13]|uniref:recombination regulator RecX n=1 Tax=Streptococcus sp. DD13 TaxID=1777881 RepID=UPI0007990E14|nr:recombination regulator RecX [Streptococcus sp. DD13]KXT79346.1 Regulatory protein recX [Streptococcus sp. DD13]